MNRLIIVATLILTGCAGKMFTKDGITQADADRDLWECKAKATQMANQMYGENGALFLTDGFTADCMTAHGYHLAAKK